MHKTLLLLGTNLGDRNLNLDTAMRMISREIGLLEQKSSVYETQAWGKEDQGPYLNQVLLVSTSLSAEVLMRKILEVESDMGRVRAGKWEPRIIDIDILFFDNDVIHVPGLDVPHPHLHERKFTLVPLAELIPHYIHPEIGKSVGQLLREVDDPLDVHQK
ncbi:MAG: 2-amino-4-hydroxy-6-hydroxymethyldihydropteridine diphosphokinase [Bacteroidetes bacterium]|nr:2-amino-4-hydroxy-6-hydroxymethyldihydropteridine diphosphokinase [Bacteroidota bacterium]MBL0066469.1 2-amino-4-hydroxy-6-hydroxymethyldihydropteridine diphosphokinase [Bacteroidota bacterium]MBL0138878.1 2-amino-4-hydroxy-6-hydroxymethyldihydropteridine diphosphokinase [Bacteroidota bacterium]